jgi:hypothetical protein
MNRTLSTVVNRAAAAHPDVGFAVTLPDGTEHQLGNEQRQDFTIRFQTNAALRRTVSQGSLGFGEGYMDGEIEVDGDWDRLLLTASAGSFRYGGNRVFQLLLSHGDPDWLPLNREVYAPTGTPAAFPVSQAAHG